jgi:multisubunit Na+/H+ antiporter MnhE subunit
MEASWNVLTRLLNNRAVLTGVILAVIVSAVCYSVFVFARFLSAQTTDWIIQATEYGLLSIR